MADQQTAAIIADALGNLIDALSDDLQHEVFHAEDVQSAVRHAVRILDDDRYTPYLDSWWLGGDETEGRFDDE